MRLLGMMIALITLFHMDQLLAEDHDQVCNSIKTNDQLSCASEKLKTSDDRLNKNYRKAQQSLDMEKTSLKGVQITWLRFRDEYCQGIYEGVSPGNEAGIEKLLCLALLTSDRANEIERMYAHHDDRDFYRALRALERAGYDREDIMNRLKTSSSSDKTWSEYVSQNCILQENITKEDRKTCKARTNFNRSY